MNIVHITRYILSVIATLLIIIGSADEEQGLGLVVLIYWFMLFAWDYYQEFRKPREERQYFSIAISIGFFVGISLGIYQGSIKYALILAIAGGLIAPILLLIAIPILKITFLYIFPKPEIIKLIDIEESEDEEEDFD